MKFCPTCGQPVAEEIGACPACGRGLKERRQSIDDYRIVDVLHEGYSTFLCQAVRERTNEEVMIRLFTPRSGVITEVAARLQRELEELKKLPGEGFVRHHAIRLSSDGLWYRTLIARLLVENKGLFESWKPYADLYSFTYHFGWHANVAAFHWLRDGIHDQELIHVGQIFNIMAVLCIYPLSKRFSKHELAGIGAVLLAGLMLHLPMTYTNWGRYTQLTGQIILLVVSVLLWEYLDGKNKSRGLLVCLWLLLGGLALTHYRVLVYALFFLLTCFAFTASRKSLLPRGAALE